MVSAQDRMMSMLLLGRATITRSISWVRHCYGDFTQPVVRFGQTAHSHFRCGSPVVGRWRDRATRDRRRRLRGPNGT